ncbi:hypothetical protein [Devosia sp. LjRoot3]|uniref:hypothetical protein n=1 Tax=Devosia sp. LjRoot3 TaxID=3342319 RepID=UPI003ECE1388
MRTIGVAAILAALSLPALSADLTPGDFRALLAESDASSVVRSLDEASWNAFLTHVEAGDRGWIDLVPLLAAGTDAGTSESLVITLSRALRANPQGVLSVLASSSYAASDICVDNEIEISTLDAVRLIDEALVKVAGVLDPALSQVRNECIYALSDARIAALI